MSKRIADTTWDDLFGAGLLALIIYALPYILMGLVIIGLFAYKWLSSIDFGLVLESILSGIGIILLYIGVGFGYVKGWKKLFMQKLPIIILVDVILTIIVFITDIKMLKAILTMFLLMQPVYYLFWGKDIRKGYKSN